MRKWMPIFDWLPRYERSWLPNDLMSGATVWAVMVPTALAYSGLVGVDPVVGLQTIPFAMLAYAVFGGSRLLVVGPDAAVSVLAGATIAALALGGNQLELAIALTVMVGAIFVLFSLLRLGWIADLIPDSVLKGVLEGLAWVTILKQMPYLLGVKTAGEAETFPAKLGELYQVLPSADTLTVAVGLVCIVAMVAFHRFLPRWPGPLIVLVLSIFAVTVFDLEQQGVAVLGETGSGEIQFGFSGGIGFDQVLALLPGAFAVVLMGFTSGVSTLKRVAEKTGERMDPDRELMAFGMANLGAGLGGGYAVTGAMSKTEVALMAGGRSQIGNLVTAGLTVITLLFLLPFFSNLADAALAALVIYVMAEISDIRYFIRLWRIYRTEFFLALIAFAGVLFYGVLAGVLIGVVLALAVLANHIRRPPTAVVGRNSNGAFLDLAEHDDAQPIPGMVIWRQYAPLTFLNARGLSEQLLDMVKQREDVHVVVIDATASAGIDTTAITAYMKAIDELAQAGIELWVCNIREVSWQRLLSSLQGDDASLPRRIDSLDEAVERFERVRASSSTTQDPSDE